MLRSDARSSYHRERQEPLPGDDDARLRGSELKLALSRDIAPGLFTRVSLYSLWRNRGEIVDFEWCPGVKEPHRAATIDFESGEVDLYYFRELPKLVIDAEAYQDDEIILAYEEGEDEFELETKSGTKRQRWTPF